MTFFILSIDGGGIRGIVPSIVLVELKRRLAQRADSQPLHRYFDLIAGTSTGGIVAAALAAPRPGDPTQPAAEPEELVDLYEQHGREIFDRNFFTCFREMFRNFDCVMPCTREHAPAEIWHGESQRGTYPPGADRLRHRSP